VQLVQLVLLVALVLLDLLEELARVVQLVLLVPLAPLDLPAPLAPLVLLDLLDLLEELARVAQLVLLVPLAPLDLPAPLAPLVLLDLLEELARVVQLVQPDPPVRLALPRKTFLQQYHLTLITEMSLLCCISRAQTDRRQRKTTASLVEPSALRARHSFRQRRRSLGHQVSSWMVTVIMLVSLIPQI
jgi:hypothetical protein